MIFTPKFSKNEKFIFNPPQYSKYNHFLHFCLLKIPKEYISDPCRIPESSVAKDDDYVYTRFSVGSLVWIRDASQRLYMVNDHKILIKVLAYQQLDMSNQSSYSLCVYQINCQRGLEWSVRPIPSGQSTISTTL